MRRFFTTSLITLALAVSAAGSAPAAHAAIGDACGTGIACPGADEECDMNSTNPTCKAKVSMPIQSQEQKDADTKIALDNANRTESSRWGLNFVMQMIAGLFAWLVGAAALTLNFSMYYTVVNMGGYITNLPAIKTVWEILRDIGNIMLIFGFLAIGISYIIDSDWYGGGKKLLPMLLIAAIFTNFSLFAAEAMIDVGNLFATQIYKQINGGEIAAPKGAVESFKDVVLNKGVAGVLLNKLGLASIYGDVIGKTGDGKNLVTDTGPWYMGFMSIIVFIVVAFVLFTLAFILISRFIVLVLLIMVSPIGVAGMAVPGLKSWADKWWHTLFHQTITAPILLLMLYIALSVIVDKNFLGFGTTTPAWGGTETGYLMEFGGTLLSYLIAVGLLLAVVYFAKTLSAVGAGWATKTAGKLSFGATGWAGRTSIGWLSTKAARGLRRTPIARIPLAGTGLVKGLEKVGSASFDVRGAKIGGGLKAAGISAGDAQKGGYKADLKARVESRTKYAADLKGKDFKDLTPELQLAIANQESLITRVKKEKTDAQKTGALTPQRLKQLNETIENAEKGLDELHKSAGTERGNKLDYASKLANLPLGFKYLAANTDAAKKIKEEARKSKDDKELDTLRKALKKAGGEEEGGGGEKKEEKEEKKPEEPAK